MSTESQEAGKPSDNTLQGGALHCRSQVWVWWHLVGMWPNYGPQQPSPAWPVVSLVTLPSGYSALQASHVHPSCLSLAHVCGPLCANTGHPKPPTSSGTCFPLRTCPLAGIQLYPEGSLPACPGTWPALAWAPQRMAPWPVGCSRPSPVRSGLHPGEGPLSSLSFCGHSLS